jgi:hypothetical protein
VGYYSPRLRVTQRCANDDLHLDPARLPLDCRQRVTEHEVLRTFVDKRSTAPDEGEAIVSLGRNRAIKSLHVGRGRGASIFDHENDACWLLAYSPTHATGERRDAYDYFQSLAKREVLFPTVEDYLTLRAATTSEQLAELATLCAEAMNEADRNPGVEARLTLSFGGTLAVLIDLIVVETDGDLRQGWVAVAFLDDVTLHARQVLDVVEASLPERADPATLTLTDRFGTRPLTRRELCWTWDSL